MLLCALYTNWMHSGKVFRVILAVIFYFVDVADASPTLTFPINAQVPPVARVSELYTFAFSASTFVSTAGAISYTLQNQPSWLKVDGTSLTLSGTPAPDDVGHAVFQLIAADSSGPTTSSVTLVVVSAGALELGNPLLPQLANVGRTSRPATLLLYPQQEFAFMFAPDTFLGTTSNTNFYAISANNSPLPSWIQFDPNKLGFSGSSPPLVSPSAAPQPYDILLIASNVPGFSEAVASFQITVGYHILTFSNNLLSFNITVGQKFSTFSLADGLLLDSMRASPIELRSFTSDAPDWLKLNADDVSLTGTPPENATNTVVIITVGDVFGDIANATIMLFVAQNASRLFTTQIPNVNATIGQRFAYSIDRSVLQGGSITGMTKLNNTCSWLEFDPRNLTFSGFIPNNEVPSTCVITLTATDGMVTDMESFDIFVLRSHRPDASSSTVLHSSVRQSSVSTASSAPTTTGSTSYSRGPVMNRRLLIIVLATILPVSLLATSAWIVVCCIRKRRRIALQTQNISQPQVQGLVIPESMESISEVAMIVTAPEEQGNMQVTPAGPPRLELLLGPDSLRLPRNRASKGMRAKSGDSPDSWGGLTTLTPGFAETTIQDEVAVPPIPACVHQGNLDVVASMLNYSRKRPPLRPTQRGRPESSSKRVSKAPSVVSLIGVGLPKRLSGAGHGSGGPQGFHNVRSSWQTTLGSIPAADSRPSTVVLDAFPSPPRTGEQSRGMTAVTDTATVRLVHSDVVPQSDSLEAHRQFFTERARDHLEGADRFSSAWSSRQQSGSRILIDASRPGRAISPTLPPDMGSARTAHSWSQWSGAGPAAARSPTRLRLHREESGASSCQFDSARSSGSQWEDENLVAEENDSGQRHWQRKAGAAEVGTPSPRLPFESAPGSPSVEKDDGLAVPPRTFRLVDNRRPVSRGAQELARSQRSHQGSLRYV